MKYSTEKEILVVLPYKESGSQGSEIRIALTAWIKFCMFNYHFVVIGTFNETLVKDFPWVEFIKFPCVSPLANQYTPHIDMQHKMEYVMNKYSNIYDGFVWMVDDNYAIKPFTLEDITTIHYHSNNFNGQKEKPTNYWNHDKWKTRQLLEILHLPHYNYTTHYPCYLEFDKLKEIWDKFDMRHYSFVLEDIYFNYFSHDTPILDSTIRLGIWDNDIYKRDFQNSVKNADIKFMCNSVEGWSKELEDDLWKIIK